MPRDYEKSRYFDCAVPRTNTSLLSYLAEVHDATNIAESQVLVQLAVEGLKHIRGDGQSAALKALGPLQAAMASMFSATLPALQVSTNGATSSVQHQGGVQPLGYDLMQSGAAEEDMDNAFGDPD